MAAHPVLVVHGRHKQGANVARRVARFLRDGGLDACPVLFTGQAGDRLPDASGGVLLVHSSGVWWPEDLLDQLATVGASGGTVFVGRSDASRLPPPLHGFPGLSLIPGQSIQPTAGEVVGWEHLFGVFGHGRRKRPPTAVFLSYSRENSDFLDEVLVPVLIDDDITYFDYRYTERLDTSVLERELERWVVASAVLLVVATPQWQSSPACLDELAVGHQHDKPIVAVWPRGTGRLRAPDLGTRVPVVSFGRDPATAGRRLVAALRRQLAPASVAQ